MRAILAATLACGAIDLAYNVVAWVLIMHRTTTLRLLQYIASGVMGKAAFEGGLKAGTVGLVLHYVVAAAWSAVFVLAYTRSAAVRQRPIPAGLALGVVAFVVMNFIVVPSSGVPAQTMAFSWPLVMNFVAHLLFVGLPIALTTRMIYSSTALAAPPAAPMSEA